MVFKKEIRISSKKSIKGKIAQQTGLIFILPALLSYGIKLMPESPISMLLAYVSLVAFGSVVISIFYFIFFYKTEANKIDSGAPSTKTESAEIVEDQNNKKMLSNLFRINLGLEKQWWHRLGKIWLAVIITAIIVGGTVYYVLREKSPQASGSKIENVSFSKSSKEYALLGREVWSAFECSAWASKDSDAKEAERLFLFAYDQGKLFLGALIADKIDREDISQEVPIGVTMVLQGPSEEFILGRIYDAAQEEALRDVLKTGNEFNLEDLQNSIAGNKFRDGNCQLIGKEL